MPLRHTNIPVPAKTFVAVSDGAVLFARVVNMGTTAIHLQATMTPSPPTDILGAQPLFASVTLAEDLALVNLFKGVGLGPYWLWAWSPNRTEISVSHG